MIPFQFGFFRLLGEITPTCFYNFDGVNEAINISNNDSLNFDKDDPMSISVWFNPSSFDPILTTNSIIDRRDGSNNGYNVAFYNQTININFLGNTGANRKYKAWSFPQINVDEWYHVLITVGPTTNPSGLECYINGILQIPIATINTLTLTTLTTANFLIGNADALNRGFNGDIDEVTIYNKELSQQDVTDIYDLGRLSPNLTSIDSYVQSCVSHWRLGENDTWNGSTWNIHDEVRREWTRFDGTNEYVNCGNGDIIADGALSASWSCWVNTTSTVNGMILGRYNGGSTSTVPAIFLVGGELRIYLSNNTSTHRRVSSPINNGEWYNITFIFNGSSSTLDIYVDGVLSNGALVGTIPTSIPSSSADNMIGTSSNISAFFDGNIDEVSIYNTELSQQDVTDIYNRGRNNPDYSDIIGIVSHWKMDELNPIDKIGSNDGTSVNQDLTNLKNDINDGISVNMDEDNRQCE